MPDPILYMKAMAAAAGASTVLALAIGSIQRPASAGRVNFACVLGMAVGLIAGYWVLDLLPREAPQNGLERFVVIVLPIAIIIELVCGIPRVPRAAAWLLRVILALATPRVLLHGSRHLADAAGDSSVGLSLMFAGAGGAVLVVVWGMLAWLVRRSPGVSLPLVLSETCLFGGVAVMLSAYPSGGEATLPLAAALAALAALAGVLRFFSTPEASTGLIGIGVLGVFGVLFAGRFFGGLSTDRALVVFFTPLVCWVAKLPPLRTLKPWKIGVIRIGLAVIPLLIVVALAKRDFDRSMEANSGYAATRHLPRRGFEKPNRASSLIPRAWTSERYSSRRPSRSA